ncbi:hypothetical protein [Sphaerisporangium rubeum]|uniref:Uncharacterized protein n=1 Tax=Sphaerisporangium rubeum TaxID=321317 RepID=A0A7X0IGE3_9ACTN|nr:hypothetical protein [Sphaerisporangium rubeum]MBB6473202.1 hypothetical protein [Sphaerisporangium rubeum]
MIDDGLDDMVRNPNLDQKVRPPIGATPRHAACPVRRHIRNL